MTEQDTLNLMFRIGKAERQLENLEAPPDVLDRIAKDVEATEGGLTPACGTEEHHGRDS